MSEPLVCRARVRCSTERAFRLFTAKLDIWWPKSHRRFEPSRLVLEATKGGRFYELGPNGDEVELGAVLLCEPPRRIVYSWRPGAITKPTEVDVRFTEEGEFTLVEVTHGEGESALGDAWADRVAIFSRAWGQLLPAFENLAASEGA